MKEARIIREVDPRTIFYGNAVIPWGRSCTPKTGRYAKQDLPAGWRSPTGEITGHEPTAIQWAKDLNKILTLSKKIGE